MASFVREEVKDTKVVKRLFGDIGITLGKTNATIKFGQVLAQDSKDGKFYMYDPAHDGSADPGTTPAEYTRNVIAGLYINEEDIVLTDAGEDVRTTISTMVQIGQSDLMGINFDTNFTALSELKRAGVIVVDKIEGMEEIG